MLPQFFHNPPPRLPRTSRDHNSHRNDYTFEGSSDAPKVHSSERLTGCEFFARDRFHRKREEKCSTFARSAFSPDAATMSIDDPLHIGKTHTRSRKLGVTVKPLERPEELVD
jgi:hypothetical protein